MLLQTFLKDRPLFRRHDPRDHVEGNQPFLGFGVAIDGKGDADPAEQQLRFMTTVFQSIRRRLLQPAGKLQVGGTEIAAGPVHFVERNCHISRLFFEAMRDNA
jgi:hypothetical protein